MRESEGVVEERYSRHWSMIDVERLHTLTDIPAKTIYYRLQTLKDKNMVYEDKTRKHYLAVNLRTDTWKDD